MMVRDERTGSGGRRGRTRSKRDAVFAMVPAALAAPGRRKRQERHWRQPLQRFSRGLQNLRCQHRQRRLRRQQRAPLQRRLPAAPAELAMPMAPGAGGASGVLAPTTAPVTAQ